MLWGLRKIPQRLLWWGVAPPVAVGGRRSLGMGVQPPLQWGGSSFTPLFQILDPPLGLFLFGWSRVLQPYPWFLRLVIQLLEVKHGRSLLLSLTTAGHVLLLTTFSGPRCHYDPTYRWVHTHWRNDQKWSLGSPGGNQIPPQVNI